MFYSDQPWPGWCCPGEAVAWSLSQKPASVSWAFWFRDLLGWLSSSDALGLRLFWELSALSTTALSVNRGGVNCSLLSTEQTHAGRSAGLWSVFIDQELHSAKNPFIWGHRLAIPSHFPLSGSQEPSLLELTPLSWEPVLTFLQDTLLPAPLFSAT